MAELHASAALIQGQTRAETASLCPRTLLTRQQLLVISDLLCMLALPLTGSLLMRESEDLFRNLWFYALLALLTVLLTASHGGYRKWARQPASIAANSFLATSLAMLALALLLGDPHILTRAWTAADLGITPLLLAGGRSLLAIHTEADDPAQAGRGTLVICYDHCPRDLPRALAEKRISRNVAGVLHLSRLHEPGNWHRWPELPDPQALLQLIHERDIKDVVFIHHPALESFSAALHQELLAELLAFPAQIWMAFDLASNLPDVLKSRSGACKLMPIATEELITSANPAKRLLDLLGGTTLLALVAPLLLALAMAVRLSSPGPVLFRQTRIGAHGRRFSLLKFRTMTHAPERPFVQAQTGDARITPAGRILRRLSLDELPQLINVLRGDMSLVGPRPHAPETQVEGLSFETALRLYRLRHRVKPGMTGLAQIRGQRGATPAIAALEQRLASDLEYIQNWSLGLDLSILLRTLPAVLSQKNAY
ncbi:exopolysaccharide biosynthesis polyprenyl glycosylphosphotransferase [Acidocella aromatica]|uniref:Exopolysaccharide biosynthesis polyprenyl glycosylphosphotransferase n=1 Tax=Acidocella aromatica TaxID=1303579 RepID=A0A840VA92_9PROT|nr:exopolysaccharide biosynthesis polyprenyl glycosylphosphotransferase [Acidocella aromatica]MBB5372858.1 exopolysaccharide biosynthesis polyprenyl glycosylphosphotransferase [Acidocella aromatica]